MKKIVIALLFLPVFIFAQEESTWDLFKSQLEIVAEGLDQSSEAITNLENNISSLTIENEQQRQLVTEAQTIIADLREKNENQISIIADVNENNLAILDLSDEIIKENERMLRQMKLSGPVTLGAIGLSVGGGFLMFSGIENGQITNNFTIGASITGATILVYSLGHYLFGWW